MTLKFRIPNLGMLAISSKKSAVYELESDVKNEKLQPKFAFNIRLTVNNIFKRQQLMIVQTLFRNYISSNFVLVNNDPIL